MTFSLPSSFKRCAFCFKKFLSKNLFKGAFRRWRIGCLLQNRRTWQQAKISLLWSLLKVRFFTPIKAIFVFDFSTQWSFIHSLFDNGRLTKFVAVPHPKLVEIAFLFWLDSTRRDVYGDSCFREALVFFLVDWKGREKIFDIKFMSSSHSIACDNSSDQRWWNNNLIGLATSLNESPNRFAQTSKNVLSNSFLILKITKFVTSASI